MKAKFYFVFTVLFFNSPLHAEYCFKFINPQNTFDIRNTNGQDFGIVDFDKASGFITGAASALDVFKEDSKLVATLIIGGRCFTSTFDPGSNTPLHFKCDDEGPCQFELTRASNSHIYMSTPETALHILEHFFGLHVNQHVATFTCESLSPYKTTNGFRADTSLSFPEPQGEVDRLLPVPLSINKKNYYLLTYKTDGHSFWLYEFHKELDAYFCHEVMHYTIQNWGAQIILFEKDGKPFINVDLDETFDPGLNIPQTLFQIVQK